MLGINKPADTEQSRLLCEHDTLHQPENRKALRKQEVQINHSRMESRYSNLMPTDIAQEMNRVKRGPGWLARYPVALCPGQAGIRVWPLGARAACVR
jgi:hypothetical protein